MLHYKQGDAVKLAAICVFLISWSMLSRASPAPQVIPAEIYDNLVFVPVSVNGSAPQDFVLDTGANISIVNQRVAATLGLGVGRSVDAKIGTGESATQISYQKHVELRIGDTALPAATVLVTSLSALESRIGHPIAGIVGADLFKTFVVSIDYAGDSISLSDSKTYVYAGSGAVLPMRIKGDRPYLSARVTPIGSASIDAFLIVDSGDTSALGFHTPYVAKHQLRAPTQPLLPHLSKGLAGDSRNWRGRVAALQLGVIGFDRPLATFAEATRGSEAESDYDGQIGGEILRRFRVTFNYRDRTMILEPNAAFTEAFESDMSGLTLSRPAPDFKGLTVESVDAGSAADQAGLMPGDAIESIDAAGTSSMPLDLILRMFKQDGAIYLLRIKRGADALEFKVQLHRRI
jgi:aspartyl protease